MIHLLPWMPPVVVPQLFKDKVEHQCNIMLAQGVIRPSTSPFSTPLLLVNTANGTWRFCADFRTLDNKTVKEKFLILIVDELLDELCVAQFFSRIDLRNGYHQVRMHLEDIEKIDFRTHQGHFEFMVMSFGLMNSPTSFQALMNDILRDFIRRFVLVFFDDILIYSSTWAEHMQHIKMVFDLMR
jgi:hypothetical protein